MHDEQLVRLHFWDSSLFGPGGHSGSCPDAVKKYVSGLAKLTDSLYKLSLVKVNNKIPGPNSKPAWAIVTDDYFSEKEEYLASRPLKNQVNSGQKAAKKE